MESLSSLPRLVRVMLRHFANGAVLGLIRAEFLPWGVVLGLRQPVALAEAGANLTLVFLAGAAMLFGTLAMSVAVMNLGPE